MRDKSICSPAQIEKLMYNPLQKKKLSMKQPRDQIFVKQYRFLSLLKTWIKIQVKI